MTRRIHKTTMTRLCARCARCALCALSAVALCHGGLAVAKPGGEPLVLDTQTGIHSGVSGTVLQTGPLGGPGMVPMATLPGPPQQEQQPIVVSPYVEYGGQTATAATPATPTTNNGGPSRRRRGTHP
ncbi:hypothetical protein P9239_10110 [Caballeronia sp. LZ062]|uniref:hypothetical protein n=1 Tax=unclassified Caballeronia TaxID=2646786 RepID=UPI002860B1F4|nr:MULTISPECIES: hypothetical protein [unclassified Caballeronia]MDR5854768.1 hypothetical protein [Caballeronia sp. LZ050]MDR5870703.1 hypothetical protein [Caballeronia sp. LZ062]